MRTQSIFMKLNAVGLLVFVVVLILMVPLIAMQFTAEVNWEVWDFVVAGGLLLFAGLSLIFIHNQLRFNRYRFLILGLIVLLFLLIWFELAVGIFGSPFAGT